MPWPNDHSQSTSAAPDLMSTAIIPRHAPPCWLQPPNDATPVAVVRQFFNGVAAALGKHNRCNCTAQHHKTCYLTGSYSVNTLQTACLTASPAQSAINTLENFTPPTALAAERVETLKLSHQHWPPSTSRYKQTNSTSTCHFPHRVCMLSPQPLSGRHRHSTTEWSAQITCLGASTSQSAHCCCSSAGCCSSCLLFKLHNPQHMELAYDPHSLKLWCQVLGAGMS